MVSSKSKCGLGMGTAVKGIVKPRKRGVKTGVPIDRPCPHTQLPMFLDTLKGLLLSFNLKKTVTEFRA